MKRSIAATRCDGNTLAPPVGLEPTTPRLTAACSTIELRRNISGPSSVEPRPVLALPIFPGRRQPSIVGRDELNYRVRNGNGWTLILINTNYIVTGPPQQQTHYTAPCSRCQEAPPSQHQGNERSSLSGDPYRIRTDVNGVRGRCLNHLTNGPRRRSKVRSSPFPP